MGAERARQRGEIGIAVVHREQPPAVMRLLERALVHEADGRTTVSPKFVTNFHSGSLRMLVAADHEAGYCATKAYNTTEGVGTRYVVSLYRLADGEQHEPEAGAVQLHR